MNMICSKEMEEYFNSLKNNAEKCYSTARDARKKNLDPEVFPEIPLAEDMASRVERLVGPDGIADRIRTLSKDLGREELSIQIAKEVVSGRFKENEKALDQAIRTGLAVLTEGVLVAPLDGIADVKIKRNFNGSHYLSIYFAGPIRSAGGTAQAMSVLIADVVRRELGLSRYLPTNEEIERYKEEIQIYKSHARTLQYTPTPEEIEIITSSCPVCIDGEGTEDVEVFGNRDLARVETNRVRGGMCLVIAEGLCLKAPKIQRHVKTLGIDGWDFVDRFVNRTKNEDAMRITPNPKYMKDIVAGRPVFSHPSRKGGFRLRYGRCRNSGLAAVGINPATMHLLDGFLAVGTQLKIERPGKAGAVVPCDSIDGAVVLLKNGDLIQVNNANDALKTKENVKEIVDLGEILISYGEFLENNHVLMQGSYCPEWWEQELKEKIGNIPEDYINPAPETAFKISEKHSVPLHPKYCLFWEDLSKDDVLFLRKFILENGKHDGMLILPSDKNVKEILIKLCALHKERNGKIVIETPYPLIKCCGLDVDNNRIVERNSIPDEDSIMAFVSKLAGIPIMEKSPSRIGSRMGRPEKAKERKMSPPVHVLFPLGMAGGTQRLVKNAVQNKTGGRLKETIVKHITVPVGLRICEKCRRKTFLMKCECGEHTNPVGVAEQSINVGELLEKAEIKLGESIPDIKGVLGLISKNKTPESIEKGALRAKHDVFVFKDGTIRFDMSNVPLTHFKPKEIGASIEKMREMGYTHDYHGKPLKSEDQIVELKVQDFVVSKSCMEYIFRAAKFVDELLEKFYDLKPFYKPKKPEDMIGHLIIGLSPHTSAGVLGRIIGWTNANAGFAHPFYHAAKRRNADGDEDCVMLLLDALLNFSRSYLPDKRGGIMDAPLVLTTRIEPNEIDKEALNFDTMSRYPLELYEAGRKNMHPKEIEKIMENVKKKVGTEKQYENFSFTMDTSNIACGPLLSSYKTLGSMEDKFNAQLNLAGKIRAVDTGDMVSKIINTHLLPDMIGNLRTFATQKFRCTKCNTIYRRIPLKGVCLKCGGNIVMTVSEGGVKKYLKMTKDAAEKYNVSNYTMQRVLLMENAINSLFHSDKINKCRLEDFL